METESKHLFFDDLHVAIHDGSVVCVRQELSIDDKKIVVSFNPSSTVYPEINLKCLWYESKYPKRNESI